MSVESYDILKENYKLLTEDYKLLTEDYKKLLHDFNNMQQSFKNICDSVHRIEQGLFGDNKIDHIGVIERLNQNEEDLKNLKRDVELARIKKEKEDAELKLNKWWIRFIAGSVGAGIMAIINYYKSK